MVRKSVACKSRTSSGQGRNSPKPGHGWLKPVTLRRGQSGDSRAESRLARAHEGKTSFIRERLPLRATAQRTRLAAFFKKLRSARRIWLPSACPPALHQLLFPT